MFKKLISWIRKTRVEAKLKKKPPFETVTKDTKTGDLK